MIGFNITEISEKTLLIGIGEAIIKTPGNFLNALNEHIIVSVEKIPDDCRGLARTLGETTTEIQSTIKDQGIKGLYNYLVSTSSVCLTQLKNAPLQTLVNILKAGVNIVNKCVCVGIIILFDVVLLPTIMLLLWLGVLAMSMIAVIVLMPIATMSFVAGIALVPLLLIDGATWCLGSVVRLILNCIGLSSKLPSENEIGVLKSIVDYTIYVCLLVTVAAGYFGYLPTEVTTFFGV